MIERYFAVMSKLISHPIIPPCEFDVGRSPGDLWDWFSSKEFELDEYHRGQRSVVSDDEEFLNQFLWHPNSRFFWDEVRPIAHCARVGLFGDNVRIRISVQCEPYDAVVIDELTNKEVFIEATSTVDGQHEKMNFRHRRLYGRSPAFQRIKYDGTKNTKYTIPNIYDSTDKPIAASVKNISEKLWEIISNRIRAKERKNYRHGIWLIVSFDDFLTFGSERKVAGLLEERLAAECLGRSQFRKIVLAGCKGRILIDACNSEETRTSAFILAP